MKKYGIVLMLAAAFLSGACDKMGLSDDAVSYEPTWAAVYDYPVSKDDWKQPSFFYINTVTRV